MDPHPLGFTERPPNSAIVSQHAEEADRTEGEKREGAGLVLPNNHYTHLRVLRGTRETIESW
jgi:hypothetical protein